MLTNRRFKFLCFFMIVFEKLYLYLQRRFFLKNVGK